MPTYVTATQVASESRLGASGFTSSTNPSTTKAGEIIAEVEAEVDCVVAAKYTLPLVTAVNILVVRSIVLALCAARVRKILDTSLPANAEQSLFAVAEKDARARLKMILEGKLILHNESPATTGDGIRSYAAANDIEPTFERETKQW